MLRTIRCLLLFTGKEFLLEWELLQISGVKISLILVLDFISVLFFSTVIIIAGRVFLYRGSYMMIDIVGHRFSWLVFSFVVSICMLIFRPNIIRVLLGWDGLGVTSYLLVNYYSREKRFNARMLTALTNRLGDIFILIFIGINCSPGIFNIVAHSSCTRLNYEWVVLIMLAAITKRAQIPFSAWLPAAIAAPTPVSALVHSSTLVTAGVYLLLRFNLLLCNNMFVILMLGCITMVMAGVSGLTESDMKKIIALSTLSQLGVMFFSVGLGEVFLRYFHLISHAYFKAIIFICAGAIIHRIGDYQDLRKIGGGWYSNPFIIRVILIGSIRLCGLPFIRGFYSKDQILEVIIISDLSLLAIFFTCFATLITVVYSSRVALRLFFLHHIGRRLVSIRDSTKELIWGNSILLIPSILGGYWLSGFLDTRLIISTPLWLKLAITTLVLMSGAACFLQPISFMTKFSTSSFFNQMWFLPWTFSVYTTKSCRSYGKLLLKVCDKSWLGWILLEWLVSYNSLSYMSKIASSILIAGYMLILVISGSGLFALVL